jgi:hypothetical protein
MNNPWLKLATFSLASILSIVVLLFGINFLTGYNSRQVGYFYNTYPAYPYDQDYTARTFIPQGSQLLNPSVNFHMQNQQWPGAPQMQQPNDFPAGYVYRPEYQNRNWPAAPGWQMQGVDNSMGMMNHMNDMHNMDMMNGMMNGMMGNNPNMQNGTNNKAGGMM